MTFLDKVRFALAMPPRVLLRALLNRGRRWLRKQLRRLRGHDEFQGSALSPVGSGTRVLLHNQSILEAEGTERLPDGTIRVAARSLLVPSHFDIAAKCIYATHRVRGVRSDWARRLYLEFTRVWNGYYEFEPRKTSAEDFIRLFDETIDSICAGGFDPSRSVIRVGRDGAPLVGAHRIAAAIACNTTVVCELAPPDELLPDYSWRYFRDHEEYVAGGLARTWADPVALEYQLLRPNCQLIILYPACAESLALDDAVVSATIGRYAAIVYDTRASFTERGQLNLIRRLYEGADWVGDDANGYLGARWKASKCFAAGDTVRIYLVEGATADDVLAAKMELRALLPAEQDAAHSTDTYEESFRTAAYFLNANSLHMINNAVPRTFPHFDRLVTRFLEWLTEHGLDREEFCIDGSAVLSAYGLRDCADLDFLHHAGDYDTAGDPEIRSHNDEMIHHHRHRDEVIFDPALHFYYRGLKFTSLAATLAMKRTRGEPKDAVDIALAQQEFGDTQQ